MRLGQMIDGATAAVPPHAWFGISAVFHYFGPSLAVLLFPAIGVLGVAWFRIVAAALFFLPVTRPWRTIGAASCSTRCLLVALGSCLAIMNVAFYLALERLPMSLVAAMEFIGTVVIALHGLRSRRNLLAVALVILGILLLIDLRWKHDPWGLFWAFVNALMFTVYIVLGHRTASAGSAQGIAGLGAAMVIAGVLMTPLGWLQASSAFSQAELVLAGIGVGICSSVIPYVCDQLAMARLPRASFALLLALLPASATIIGAVVLAQWPGPQDMAGLALVMAGLYVHQSPLDPVSVPDAASAPL